MSHSPTSEDQPRDSYEQGWSDILELINSGGSWSGRERNCCLLNTGGEQFADVSAVTGLDFLDDGRCIATVDWDHDGDLDLWMASRTGPRLRFIRNDTNVKDSEHQANYVAFQLEGVTCNRNAIGARMQVRIGDTVLLRSLRSESGYLTQPSKWLHFGLGQATEMDDVKVRWPDGKVEKFTVAAVNGRYVLKQGTGVAEPWQVEGLDHRAVDLQPQQLATHEDKPSRRLVLLDRLPSPPLPYKTFEGADQWVDQDTAQEDGPTLVTLWATWCVPCVEEFNDLQSHAQQLQASGLRVLALSVDALSSGAEASVNDDKTNADGVSKASKFWETRKYPFDVGMATPALIDRLDAISASVTSLRAQPNAIPSSYLLDRHGRIAVIYPGPIDTEQLLADLQTLQNPAREAAFPLAGRWFQAPNQMGELIGQLARTFYSREDVEAASRYASLAADLSTRDAISPGLADALANIFFRVGADNVIAENWQEAADHFQLCLRFRDNDAEAHANLGYAARMLGDLNRAWSHLQIANDLSPELPPVHFNLGLMLLEQNAVRQAAQHFQQCVDLDPDFGDAHNYLGVALARMGRLKIAAQHLQRASQLGNEEAKRNLATMLNGGTP